MGKCPGSLARHRSLIRVRASAAGPEEVSGHSGHTQIQGAGGNKFPSSVWEEMQGLPERRTLWSPEKSAVLHFPCLQTSGCATSLREQGISAGLSGQLCLSSPFGWPPSQLLSSLGRKMCFSVALLSYCAALVDTRQGTVYLSSPWLSNTFGLTPSLYTEVKQKWGLSAWRLYCVLTDIVEAPFPDKAQIMLREVVIHLFTTYICLLLAAPALSDEGSTSLLPWCFSKYRISSLSFSSSFGLRVLHLVSEGWELLAALLCTYTTWPQGRKSCLWALWNIPDPYPVINNINSIYNINLLL